MGSARQRGERLLRPFRDFLFPPLCFSCGERLQDLEIRVCAKCWDSIATISPGDETVRVLAARFAAEGSLDGFWSFCYFEHGGAFQKLTHALKYEGMTWCGEEFGRRLARSASEHLDLAGLDGVVPIPLHPVRLRERGYNQSERICRGISAECSLKVLSDLLRRTKNTTTQTHLSADQRKRNVLDAFAVSDAYRDLVKGKIFLLVDDVITTGSTLQAAGRALKDSGAAHVYGASAGLAQLD